MMQYAAIFVGGGLGSLARFFMGVGIKSLGWMNAWATLFSNAFATAILLAVIGLWSHSNSDPNPFESNAFLFWTVGFCGAFSTFSTFSADTIFLVQSHGWVWAAANVMINLCVCMALAAWVWSSWSPN